MSDIGILGAAAILASSINPSGTETGKQRCIIRDRGIMQTVKVPHPPHAEDIEARDRWCQDHCRGAYRMSAQMARMGQPGSLLRFRFADPDDAAMFRRTFA